MKADFRNKPLHTIFGTASFDGNYYRISSRKEGNYNKRLHRLIYENFYGINLSDEIEIHHKDGNKLNNCILNLEALTKSQHSSLHKTGENNPMFNKTHSTEIKKFISEARKGKKHSEITLNKMSKNISKSKTSTGYYRVSKHLNKNCKQGFEYVYEWKVNGKRNKITSVDINKLKNKVLAKGLEWINFNEEVVLNA